MGAAIEIGTGRFEVLNKDIRSPGWVSKMDSNIEARDYFMSECPKRPFNASNVEAVAQARFLIPIIQFATLCI
jgi:hypothetical protein